jgi:hypothetical protein
MTRVMPKSASPSRSDKTGQYVSVGRTSDGVRVLSTPVKSTHFTPRQIREAISTTTPVRKG